MRVLILVARRRAKGRGRLGARRQAKRRRRPVGLRQAKVGFLLVVHEEANGLLPACEEEPSIAWPCVRRTIKLH